MNETIKAHIALFLVALIYGGNYSIAKLVMDGQYLKPLGFILLRVIVGCILFWLVHLLFVKESVARKDLGLMALCGFFGVAANQMLFFSGLDLTQPIHAALIMTTTPILVLILSAILIRERITSRKVAGIITGASGAFLLIAYGHRIEFAWSQVTGDIMVFLNASAFGTYLVLIKPLMSKYNPLTVIKWVFFFGLLFVIPFGGPQLADVDWHTFSWVIILSVVYVLIFTTFFAYLLNAYALRAVSPAVVSIYIYLQPVLAALIAIAMGSDTLNFIKILSATLIFLGVYLSSTKRPLWKTVKQRKK